jgi:SpoVK/Ycf46/Vps4 family AAA+-type ATPase
MWGGGTEQAIAQAFQQAEGADGILLLDEADSLFLNRAQVHHSWERSQTNELLTQMESYSGVLVCCTNLLANLDPAALRRFAFKVGFKLISKDGRITLFKRYFPKVELTIEAAERLSRLNGFTPGDFKAVHMRMRFSTALEAKAVVGSLTEECGYRIDEERIGFTTSPISC